MAATRISDVIVPEIFTPYSIQATQEKSRIIQSNAVTLDAELSNLLNGGGLTFNMPFWRDLDSNDEENVSNDDPTIHSAPEKINADAEVQVRLSRNNSWSSMQLASTLAGSDPMEAIGERVSTYWSRRLQKAFIATMKGVFADNDAAPTDGEHVQGDLTYNVSGSAFVDGVTNFGGSAFIDATVTMGDSQDALGLALMHSIVYARALKQNMIQFLPVSSNNLAQTIPTYLGREVIVDDGMPNNAGVFETWLFGEDAVRIGVGSPEHPTEVERIPSAGNGGGQEVLYNRVEWIIHPVGHAYVGTAPAGGPSNAATTNNLANAGSWKRVFQDRKSIKIARLITREFAVTP